MHSEIGSEFWINNSNIPKKSNELPSWLENFGHVTLTTSGRGALSLLLEQVNPSLRRVLLPAYICESVILPFEKAGFELSYYNVDKQFTPDDIELIKSANIGIFLHMGYFGYQTNAILAEIVSELKSKSVIVIEDVTHTLFSNHNLIVNDFVFGSIRKWFGIPSGGFMASDKNMNYELPNDSSDFIDLRVRSLNEKFEYIISRNISKKARYLSGFKAAEQILDEDVKAFKIDEISENLIQGLDDELLQNRRRTNYEALINGLDDLSGIEVIFSKLENNMTPFFFPIYIKNNRNELRRYLTKQDIYCPVHWPISKQLKGHMSNGTKEIYNSILSIPCDQRYLVEDMTRVTDEIRKFVKE